MQPAIYLRFFNWFQKLFYRLSIRQKVFCGHGLALGIAVFGTVFGLVIGDLYSQQARQKMTSANSLGNLLSSLQGVLLEVEAHEQALLPILIQQQALQQENADLEENLQQVETLFSQLKDFSQTLSSPEDLKGLVNKYDHQLGEYLQKVRYLNSEIALLSLQSGEVAKAQELIWNFNQSQATYTFYQYTRDLADLDRKVIEYQQEADIAYNQASILQVEIIIVSLLLSVAIATTLGLYTSRIIAQPINAVTDLAQKVTQESDFELQVPVTSQDEIGSLARSLNQLIQQVKHLLEIQASETQTKLIQSEKMSSLGRMLAGIAHEINNPVNFISGNLGHANTCFIDLFTLIHAYKESLPNPPTQVKDIEEQIDLEFLEVDLPKLFHSIMIGVDRTKEIVRSLKDFSRIDEGIVELVDIHNCLDSTLLILNNRLKKGINVVRNYGKIPPVTGYTGLLYQVFMNLLSNASEALDEKMCDHPAFSPEINIITELAGSNWVIVRILDNGPGISPENLQKIFEMFFTTKPRGIGTGLGLAITYQIVVDKHHGKITCNSELNKGTEFVINLPISQK